jgi:hypothetical protein
MRSIKTFVLHLYTDPEAPQRLCGEARLLEDVEFHSFKNAAELDALLRHLIDKTQVRISPPAEDDPQQPA